MAGFERGFLQQFIFCSSISAWSSFRFYPKEGLSRQRCYNVDQLLRSSYISITPVHTTRPLFVVSFRLEFVVQSQYPMLLVATPFQGTFGCMVVLLVKVVGSAHSLLKESGKGS